MRKTLLGIVAYGNLSFLKLSLCEALTTAKGPLDIAVVVAMPGDMEMIKWLRGYPVQIIINNSNKGLAGSVNDLTDRAFFESDYDNLIIMGNDVVPYPNAIDAMIECANSTLYEWICSTQFSVKMLTTRYPEAGRYFAGNNLLFTDFTARPWDLHSPAELAPKEEIPGIRQGGIRDLCLFKRSVFLKIGYADVNFWPNGYSEDIDFCRRALLADVKGCALPNSTYFHFWSRTIHQGEKRAHDKFFLQNQFYYERKWGGHKGSERFAIPFSGEKYKLTHGLTVAPSLKIDSRVDEIRLVEFWQSDAVKLLSADALRAQPRLHL